MLYTRNDSAFIRRGLFELLGTELITQLPLSPQITGNCSWANVEAAVLALFFLLQLAQTDMSPKAIKRAECTSFYLFNSWLEWDKENALNLFIEDFKTASKPRRISKAEVLASILFQYLDYHNRRDIKKAQKIIPLLLQPDVLFILKNYLEVFYREHKTPNGRKLVEILDDFGIDEELIQ